jgi:hypothetical protein
VAGIWLFVRGAESIRVLLRQDEQGVRVLGPGDRLREYEFKDSDARVTFQIDLARQLAASGWILEQFSDRRSRFDRRGSQRGHTSERRRS